MLFNLSNLNSNLALTLGYLNRALNNSAQMVKLPRHATKQPTAWPQWKLFFFFFPVFFFLFFFFFSFYLLFLLKPSPIFFISSFLSPTGFSVPHKHLTATPSGSPTHPPVTAATWIYLHHHFYSILNYFMISSPYWMKNKK